MKKDLPLIFPILDKVENFDGVVIKKTASTWRKILRGTHVTHGVV
jgi:hypothetical protein